MLISFYISSQKFLPFCLMFFWDQLDFFVDKVNIAFSNNYCTKRHNIKFGNKHLSNGCKLSKLPRLQVYCINIVTIMLDIVYMLIYLFKCSYYVCNSFRLKTYFSYIFDNISQKFNSIFIVVLLLVSRSANQLVGETWYH